MKGERTIDDKPFRYGGIERDYDRTSEEWEDWRTDDGENIQSADE